MNVLTKAFQGYGSGDSDDDNIFYGFYMNLDCLSVRASKALYESFNNCMPPIFEILAYFSSKGQNRGSSK